MRRVLHSLPGSHAGASVFTPGRFLVSFLVSFLALLGVIVGFGLTRAEHGPRTGAPTELFVERWVGYLRPEPDERTVYLLAICLTLPIVVLADRATRGFKPSDGASAGLAIAVSGLLYLPMLPQGFTAALLLGQVPTGVGAEASVTLLSVVALIAAVVTIHLGKRQASAVFTARQKPAPWLGGIVLLAIVATVILPRIRTADMVVGDMHVEAVFYSISQVAAGRTLLADLPSQYGLFAELLRPYLSVAGPSVLSVSILLALLQALGCVAIVACVFGLVRTPLLQGLAIATVFAFVGSTWMFPATAPVRHEYFQVWPIRFLFPALSVALFVAVRRRGLPNSGIAMLALLSGVAVLWNLDSGIPVWGALVACLLLRLMYGTVTILRWNAWLLCLALAVPSVTVLLFLLYLGMKSGGTLSIAEWLQYQRIFFATGFGMLPMPLSLHPWMTVAAVYLLGIVVGVSALAQGRDSVVTDSLIFLSILGLGLFTYYQGRSHVIVLSFVLWPAVLVAFALADTALRGVRAGVIPGAFRWSAVPVVAFGLIMTVSWVKSFPSLAEVAVHSIRNIGQHDSGEVGGTTRFIKNAVGESNRAVIIDRGQAVYFAQSGLASALPGPGLVEMLLKSDMDVFLAGLSAGTADHVFVRLERDGTVSEPFRSALAGYRESSRHGTMLHLVPQRAMPRN